MSLLQILASAGQGALDGYDHAQQMKRQKSQDEMQQQLQQAQLGQYNRQADQQALENQRYDREHQANAYATAMGLRQKGMATPLVEQWLTSQGYTAPSVTQTTQQTVQAPVVKTEAGTGAYSPIKFEKGKGFQPILAPKTTQQTTTKSLLDLVQPDVNYMTAGNSIGYVDPAKKQWVSLYTAPEKQGTKELNIGGWTVIVDAATGKELQRYKNTASPQTATPSYQSVQGTDASGQPTLYTFDQRTGQYTPTQLGGKVTGNSEAKRADLLIKAQKLALADVINSLPADEAISYATTKVLSPVYQEQVKQRLDQYKTEFGLNGQQGGLTPGQQAIIEALKGK